MNKVALNIIALANAESSPGNFALILEDPISKRRLPIIIGKFEAQAIAIPMEEMKPARPQTHDLFKNTLDKAGIQINEVIISKLEKDIFYAKIIGLTANGKDLEVDARTSDAIALAIRYNCAIFTTQELIKQNGLLLNHPTKELLKRDQNLENYTLQELKQLLENALKKEDYELASRIRDTMDKK